MDRLIEPIDLRRPTFVVLDAPAPLSEYILELRAKYRPEYAPLPVEITLIGSSGAGVLEPDQAPPAVLAAIEAVAERTAPIKTGFEAMTTFPGSGVFFFPPAARVPFDELQARLLAAGLRCVPSPFPFTPHLTVARIKTRAAARELLAAVPPKGDFVFDHLAVYSQVGFETRLHRRIQLRGRGDARASS